MEKPLETGKGIRGRVSGNHQGEVNSRKQVDGVSDTAPTCQLCGGLSKGTMASAGTSVWEKAALLAVSLKPDNSVPPRRSLVPFELLPQC